MDLKIEKTYLYVKDWEALRIRITASDGAKQVTCAAYIDRRLLLQGCIIAAEIKPHVVTFIAEVTKVFDNDTVGHITGDLYENGLIE